MKTNIYFIVLLVISISFQVKGSESELASVIESGFYSEIAADIDTKIEAMLAAEREALPIPGELLYEITDVATYQFNSANGATMQRADAAGEMPFGRKFILDIKQAGTNAWEPQFQTPVNEIPLGTGDKILYIFYIRKTQPSQNGEYGQAAFFSQKASSPWTGLGSLSLAVYDSWKKYYVIAEAGSDYAIGEMTTTFHLGFKTQVIEIGGIIALNMGNNVNVDDLPLNDIYYDGMEQNAAWRAEAEAGIEANRKANLSIEVLDKEGNPLADVEVFVEMKQHHFGFGSFISDLLLENSSDGDRYREHFLDLFNVGTTPFYMGGKDDNWGWYGSATSQANYPKFAQWFKDNNIPAKGHVLIWPSWTWMPSFFEDLADSPAELEQAISDHLDLIVPIGKENNLYEWDVLNEPFINHDVMDILGEEIMVDWFNHVHNLHPQAKLIMNEYNIIQGGGREDFQENFIRIINFLKSQGAPLGGIGMQCHFDENLTGIPYVLSTLDRFGELGLPIQITEFDVDTRDEEIQAEYTRDFYTAVFSHPKTEKIVMWGFYEPTMWKPNGALIRPDWSHKPNYDAFTNLVYNQWWTNDTVYTGSDGKVVNRGFKGNYDINISTPDTTYSINITMKNDVDITISGSSVEILGIEEDQENTLGLLNAYPNPFDANTIIEYSLESPSEVDFKLFDSTGRLLLKKEMSHSSPGTYHFTIGGQRLDPGIYTCLATLEGSNTKMNSVIIVKKN